jgi:hypothetical protein
MVRWGWLAFPLAVLILSVVFFIATVLRMKPDDVGIWKSTPLAFLLCLLDDSLRQKLLVDLDSKFAADGAERRADSPRVKVVEGEDGWRI